VTVDLVALDPAVTHLITQSDIFRRKGDLVSALAVIQKAHAFAPEDARLNNYLAWALALCPDEKMRDPKRAVEAAKKAVGAAENNTWHLRTLGVAHHFAGDDKAAVTFLVRSLKLRKNGEAFDYFPLAAAHQQLGNNGEARKWYLRGVAWMAANKHPHMAELTALRADAEALLGIEKQSKPAPDKTSPGKKE
jgi:tetratricopeptide (TPR) repeat protein